MAKTISRVQLVEILGVPVVEWIISGESTPEDAINNVQTYMGILAGLEYPVYAITDISEVKVTEVPVDEAVKLFIPIVDSGKLELMIAILPEGTETSKDTTKVSTTFAAVVSKALKGKIPHSVCYSRQEAELILAKWLASKQK